MRIFGLPILAISIALTTSCMGPAPEYRTSATVKDIMDSIVDPNADFLWESVSTEVNAKGITEKAPHTDDEWRDLRRHTIALMEATDLLQIPGRAVAKPGEKADNPQVEEPPEVIKTMIEGDRRKWIDATHALHDAAVNALKAVDAKSADGVLDAGDQIDKACETCHKMYWYPEKLK
jgi:hypothetical protein